MAIRPTQSSIFSLVARGLAVNFNKLAVAQESVATGKRIQRPSDDAVGTARALSMRRRLGLLDRFQNTVSSGRPILETSASALEEASGILSEARALLVQSMSGSMNPTDRQAIGLQIDLILEKLVDVANTKVGDRYVFAGTKTDRQPYDVDFSGDVAEVTYQGNDSIQRISVGFGTELALNVAGSQVFGTSSVTSVDFAGLSGASLGTSANQGAGYADLFFRHDATVGAPGSGLALVNGGAQDTILNDHTLTVDAATSRIQLGSGGSVTIPAPTSPDYTDFVVTGADGAELHLDFSGYTGVSSSNVLTGQGSVSLGGATYTAMTFAETNLELIDSDSNTVMHINTTNVSRAGKDLVSFTGATDIFSVLGGLASDLRNTTELEVEDVVDRLQLRFDELEGNFNQVLKALGTLGARTERLISSGTRLETISLNVEGLLSQVEDADITSVILQMNQAEQTLQLAQATGSRLIQHSLLDFLR
ncbi:MAG: flagellar hook-associated protein 3 FlgL [Candidatus Paceibacteria bacterium]|jgi:flagellar hook-associated protein 3 FlgL